MKKRILGRCAFAYLLLFAAVAGHASCGLHVCPRHSQPPDNSWNFGWTQSQSGFHLGGVTGTYAEGIADAGYTRGDSWVASVHVPFLALQAGSHSAYGIGNPLAVFEARFHPGPGNMAGLGLQSEFPLGDAASGLAQEHFMIMPYASLDKSLSPFFLGVSAGAAVALGGHGHGDMAAMTMEGMNHPMSHGMGSPLYVHPHGDFELTYRASLGIAIRSETAHPEQFQSGQHVLTKQREQGDAADFLSGGVSVPIRHGSFVLAPDAELPLTEAHRFEWTVGCRIAVDL
jgi:hypothetical protein